jgi:uncharacterized membrane protein
VEVGFPPPPIEALYRVQEVQYSACSSSHFGMLAPLIGTWLSGTNQSNLRGDETTSPTAMPLGEVRRGEREAGMTEGTDGLEENVAGLLCYALGWVSGLIFFLIDKRPYVRSHAAQAMVVFGGLQIIWIVLTRALFGSLGFGGRGVFSLGGLLLDAVQILGLVLWIVLMVKAYQGERFKVPVAADIAEGFANKS